VAEHVETGSPPPPAEVIHMPEPSYLPVVVALGLTIGLLGIVLVWPVSVIGAVIFLIAVVRWVRQTREEIEQLPLEHHQAP
jgi:hypothetical protein